MLCFDVYDAPVVFPLRDKRKWWVPFTKTKPTAATERTPTEKGLPLATLTAAALVRSDTGQNLAPGWQMLACVFQMYFNSPPEPFPTWSFRREWVFSCSDTGLKYFKDLDVALRTVATLLLKTMEYNEPSSASHEQHPRRQYISVRSISSTLCSRYHSLFARV